MLQEDLSDTVMAFMDEGRKILENVSGLSCAEISQKRQKKREKE